MPDPDYDWKVLSVDATGTATQAAAVTLNDAVADTLVSPMIGSVMYLYDAGTPDYNRVRSANNVSDAAAGGTFQPVALMVWNGTTWDRADSVNTGQLVTTLKSSSGTEPSVQSLTDAQASLFGLVTLSRGQHFNGATFDRIYNNTDVTLLASASRTTTQTSADITTYNASGIHVVLDMTVVGTGSVTVTINGKDAVSGKYYLLLSGAAVITNSTNVYKIFPGAPATANVSANDHLPRTIQIVVTHNNGNAATYSVGYSLLI
jgi:hypothetical protein